MAFIKGKLLSDTVLEKALEKMKVNWQVAPELMYESRGMSFCRFKEHPLTDIKDTEYGKLAVCSCGEKSSKKKEDVERVIASLVTNKLNPPELVQSEYSRSLAKTAEMIRDSARVASIGLVKSSHEASKAFNEAQKSFAEMQKERIEKLL